MQERLCINLVHLNIQVSVPRPLAVMQQVWNTYQRTSCSPPPSSIPPSIQPSRERKNCPLQPQPTGGSYSNPVLSETAHKHFDNKNTHTHTHKQQSWVTPGHSENRKHFMSVVLYNNLLLSGKYIGEKTETAVYLTFLFFFATLTSVDQVGKTVHVSLRIYSEIAGIIDISCLMKRTANCCLNGCKCTSADRCIKISPVITYIPSIQIILGVIQCLFISGFIR